MQHSSPASRTSELLLAATLALISLFAFSYSIDAVPPYHTDENFYVESVKNMTASGDYITPVYHEKKRFAKPILYYWLVAASYKLFGADHASARLVSALSGALCVFVTFLLARRLFDSRTAFISASILPGLYLHAQISRWAITDMTVALFILTSLYCFIRAVDTEKIHAGWIYGFYIFIGLGFMTKGPPALLIPAATLATFFALRRDASLLKPLRIFQGLTLVIAMNLPWFTTMFLLHGDEFSDHILGAEIRDRVMHDLPFSFYYFGVLFRYHLPWSLFTLAALIFWFTPQTETDPSTLKDSLFLRIKNRAGGLLEDSNKSLLFCLAWVVAPTLIFTLFRIEHSRYLLPLSPALAMITGYFLCQLADSKQISNAYFKYPFVATLGIYMILAFAGGVALWTIQPLFEVPLSVIFMPLCLGLGSLVLWRMHRKGERFRLVLSLAFLQIIFLGLLNGAAHPFLDRYPMKHFSEIIRAQGNGDEKITAYQLGSHRARLGIMTGQMAINVEDVQEIVNVAASPQPGFVVLREEDWNTHFQSLPLKIIARDTGWKKGGKKGPLIKAIWQEGILSQKDNLLETYFLLGLK
ncbi:MAG: glycosyltransferase family 39 protein [Candidatus Nitrohelix vancouverensis]|uniref:Glycosyltransferase family 39 protein n=1 Tax=Candidatus Nitrohelix vancouverensis TaxID=2705534 RepID=A0A7T0C273_9BACT|nr:MAG: glycosyltransferase family 39 protein [Candidatus Nitrohelix vancouverensis]